MFRFSDPDECSRCLGEAGFREVQTTIVPQHWRLPSADALLLAVGEGMVRTRALLVNQKPEAMARIRAAVREGLRPYQVEQGLSIPMPVVMASGRRPQ